MPDFRDQVDGYRPDARRLKERRDTQQAQVAGAAVEAARAAEHYEQEALELGKEMVQYLIEQNAPSIPVREKSPAMPARRGLLRKQKLKPERRAWVVYVHVVRPSTGGDYGEYHYGGLIDDGRYFCRSTFSTWPGKSLSQYDADSKCDPAVALAHLKSQEFMRGMAMLVESGEPGDKGPSVAFPY